MAGSSGLNLTMMNMDNKNILWLDYGMGNVLLKLLGASGGG
jgi:hypothetical protein